MSPQARKSNIRRTYRRVFHSKVNFNISFRKLTIESIVYISLAILIIINLNKIEDRIELFNKIPESLFTIIDGLVQFSQGLIQLSELLLVVLLLLASLVLLVGGLWRVIKLISLLNNKAKEHKKSTYKTRYKNNQY